MPSLPKLLLPQKKRVNVEVNGNPCQTTIVTLFWWTRSFTRGGRLIWSHAIRWHHLCIDILIKETSLNSGYQITTKILEVHTNASIFLHYSFYGRHWFYPSTILQFSQKFEDSKVLQGWIWDRKRFVDKVSPSLVISAFDIHSLYAESLQMPNVQAWCCCKAPIYTGLISCYRPSIPGTSALPAWRQTKRQKEPLRLWGPSPTWRWRAPRKERRYLDSVQHIVLCLGAYRILPCYILSQLSIILFDQWPPNMRLKFCWFFKAEEKSDGEKSATESEKPEADSENAVSSEKKEEEGKEEAPPDDPYDNPMLVHVSYGSLVLWQRKWTQNEKLSLLSLFIYRVTIQVVLNLPLTSKEKFRFSTWASY